MMKHLLKRITVISIIISSFFIFNSCATTTKLSSIKQKGFENKIQNVAIIFNDGVSINKYVENASKIMVDSLNNYNINSTVVIVPNLKAKYPEKGKKEISEKLNEYLKKELSEKNIEYFLIFEAKVYVYSGGYNTWPMDIEFELKVIELSTKKIVWKSKLEVSRKSLDGNANSKKSAEDSIKYVIEDLRKKQII